MKNELAIYVEPESMGEESSQTEMKLYAELQGYTSTPNQIDKPADPRLVSEVKKAKAENVEQTPAPVAAPAETARTSRPVVRVSKYGLTITDFILLLIAGLLFLNIVTK